MADPWQAALSRCDPDLRADLARCYRTAHPDTSDGPAKTRPFTSLPMGEQVRWLAHAERWRKVTAALDDSV